MMELIYIIIENFILCNYMYTITSDIRSTGDIAYSSPWYQMSRMERICVEMIIRRSQQLRELRGLGLFVCSLEVYFKVCTIDFVAKYSGCVLIVSLSQTFSWFAVPSRTIWCSVNWMRSNVFDVGIIGEQLNRYNLIYKSTMIHRYMTLLPKFFTRPARKVGQNLIFISHFILIHSIFFCVFVGVIILKINFVFGRLVNNRLIFNFTLIIFPSWFNVPFHITWYDVD